jgi:hypothetical protein
VAFAVGVTQIQLRDFHAAMKDVNTTLSPLSGRRANPFERRAQLFFALDSFGDSLRQSKEK